MKKTGDYYVAVVEDTNLGQIIATATLIVEHKFIHSCAKVNQYSNKLCFLVAAIPYKKLFIDDIYLKLIVNIFNYIQQLCWRQKYVGFKSVYL